MPLTHTRGQYRLQHASKRKHLQPCLCVCFTDEVSATLTVSKHQRHHQLLQSNCILIIKPNNSWLSTEWDHLADMKSLHFMNKGDKSRLAVIVIMHITTSKIEATAVRLHNMRLHAHYSQPLLEVWNWSSTDNTVEHRDSVRPSHTKYNIKPFDWFLPK